MNESLEIARALARARKSGEKLEHTPGAKPESVEAAFRLQQAVTRALGWTQCGWKVGATSTKAQAILGIDAPFVAPLFTERTFESGEHVLTAASHSRIVEPEIAFVLGESLPSRSTPYSAGEVLGAVASIHPALELVNPRLPGGLQEPIEWTIADGGIHDAFVLGPGSTPTSDLDYATITARARRNETWITSGTGANVLGGPDRVLTWVANFLLDWGLQLQRGDIVTTGVLTDILDCELGDEVAADFTTLGCVHVRL